jgi:hypothetical protein
MNKEKLDKFLKEHNAFESFYKNKDNDKASYDENAISSAFCWIGVQEGHYYWEALDKKWRSELEKKYKIIFVDKSGQQFKFKNMKDVFNLTSKDVSYGGITAEYGEHWAIKSRVEHFYRTYKKQLGIKIYKEI